MNLDLPVFRIGKTNFYVQPGDIVWIDRKHCLNSDKPMETPVIVDEPIFRNC